MFTQDEVIETFRTSHVVFCLNDLDVGIHAVVDESLGRKDIRVGWSMRRGANLMVTCATENNRLVVTVDNKRNPRSSAPRTDKGLRLPTVGVEGDRHALRTPENTSFMLVKGEMPLRYASDTTVGLVLYVSPAGSKYAVIP